MSASHGRTAGGCTMYGGMTRAVLLVGALLLLAGCQRTAEGDTPTMTAGGDAARGKSAIAIYGCGACHVIPGVSGADGLVGPPLTQWSRRAFIAGEVPNTPAQLVRWIQHPQMIEPGTAMPDLGVSERDARDIATYLGTIR